jgi:hypothetical protein
MKEMKFKCTLLSDVILNVKSATDGNQQTLDFIPGNNFLGIVASQLYFDDEHPDKHTCLSYDDSWTMFHSGNVRFGDAHPVAEADDTMRTLRVPASMFYPKMKKASDICYIHHCYNRDNDHEGDNKSPQQLKQCRSGFYAFSNGAGHPSAIDKQFAIKSAYDRVNRRSKDKCMYGYESLCKDMTLFFSVEIDDDKWEDTIKKALCGKHHVGRSRTAQYGLVNIEEADYKEVESIKEPLKIGEKKYIAVYADSRLIFLDEYGQATFQPTAEQLGLDVSASICWEKSQVRTFQYAPWNFKRQAYDTDRCGIEKGSVFIVECKACPDKSRYVGSYRNEGFGKVIYNPTFLEIKPDAINGEALYTIEEPKVKVDKEIACPVIKDNALLSYLREQKRMVDIELVVYRKVNEFVKTNESIFKNDTFASQWGTIRSIAMQWHNKEDLNRELFNKPIMRNGKEVNNAYLAHGVAKDKWEERGRLKVFKDFFDKKLDESNVQLALINLASQMSKLYRRKENK